MSDESQVNSVTSAINRYQLAHRPVTSPRMKLPFSSPKEADESQKRNQNGFNQDTTEEQDKAVCDLVRAMALCNTPPTFNTEDNYFESDVIEEYEAI